MRKRRLLKVVTHEWKNASRDKRDLSAAQEVGFQVAVMCKGNPKDKMKNTEIEGFQAYLCGTRPVSFLPTPINRIIASLQWVKYIREYQADVLNCENLNALQIGYLSILGIAKSKKPKLVYDAHEFELARNTDGKRGKVASWAVKKTEAFLMKKCDLSVMVNESIARETARIHKLQEMPLVIRNVSENWKLNAVEIEKQRMEFVKQLNISRETFLIMYHGGLMRERGIEQAIEVTARNKEIALIILGNGSSEYVNELKQKVINLGVKDRVLFHSAVPHDELWKYVGAVDVGMVIIQNICKSYYYTLPNKFFENIQSLIPVICSDFPEIGKITRNYKIGLVCNPENIEELNEQIEILRTNKEIYKEVKENLKAAKEELCWENEKEKLVLAYKKIYKSL